MKPITLKDIEHELPMCDEMDSDPRGTNNAHEYFAIGVMVLAIIKTVWGMVWA